MPYKRFIWMPVVLLAGLLLWSGCDNTLDPFAEDHGLFSVYGYLTLSNGPHFIRIKDLNDPVINDSARTLDATVTLENLATGTTETLTDSIVVFEGIYTHNFRTDQEIQPATPYRLTVERSDGRAVQVTATMPERTNVEVTPAKTDTVDCIQDISLSFQNVPDPRLIQVIVGVTWNDAMHWVNRDVPAPTQYGFLPWRIVKDVGVSPFFVPGPMLGAVLVRGWCYLRGPLQKQSGFGT